MITNEMYTQAIFKAKYAIATDVTSLLNMEKAGCNTDWSLVTCNTLQVKKGLFIFSLGNLNSVDAVNIYNSLLQIAGVNDLSDVFIDPYAQIDGLYFTNPDPTGIFDNYYTKAQSDQLLEGVRVLIKESFTDDIEFTYDGTNNELDLSFEPNAFGTAHLDNTYIDQYIDYKYQDGKLIVNPELLTVGVTYLLSIQYFK